MSKVAVVYHSGFGHTAVQAEAVRFSAAAVPGTEVHLITVSALAEGSLAWQHLDTADAIIFGSPTYMAGPSAAYKAFMDASSSRYAEQAWADKLAAGFTNSTGMNGDKLNTLQSFALFAMQHSMVWIGLGLPPGNSTLAGSPDELNRLAGFLGAMAQSPADAGPDIAPAGSDLRTAAYLGRRVAEAAARWRAGRPVAVQAVAS